MAHASAHRRSDPSPDDMRDRRSFGTRLFGIDDRMKKGSGSPPLLPALSTSSSCRGGSETVSLPPRRLRFVLKMILVVSVACLGTVVVEQQLDRRPSQPVETVSSKGIMFFAYGAESRTADHYMQQAVVSARRIKALNPSVNITIVANPDVVPPMEGAFDVLINVEKEMLYSGRVQAWTANGVSRQWLTRLEYLACSPYEVTLALDSQALCCASDVNNILGRGWEEFDIAFATQGPRAMGPHNWAIMYRFNDRTRRLFDRWRTLQIDYARDGTDQLTLHMAAGSLALQNKLSVGVLSQNVALATVIHKRAGPEYPKSSSLLEPRPARFVHYDATSDDDADETCEKINHKADRARVVLLPRPFPKDEETRVRLENIYEMVYSDEELGAAVHAARKDAGYFQDLDWKNASKRWGRPAIPWKDLYPGCWDDLADEVNVGIRHIYHNPERIWSNARFAEEFHGDNLEWPE